jgi:hypothetical protein
MDQADRLLALFKFGKREHMEKFVSEGLLYMNTLEHFRRLEACSVRGDPNEGISHSFAAEGGKLGFKVKIDDEYQSIGTLAGPIQGRQADLMKTNVFCMYGPRASNTTILVDPRNMAFGDTFVLLKYGDEFLRRAKEAARKSGHQMLCHMVHYVDQRTYRGEMGPFRKYSEFAYQNEVRLALLPGTGAVHELRLGDLSDIVALTAPLADINNRIRIEPEDVAA